MNKDIAIKVENLSKVYKLYNAPIDRMKEALHPFKKNYHKEFYALNDISFEVKKGECVGIIGRNGAGKSTLLKIITGVLTPSGGKLTTNGRIASLLELGAGFNSEYTGMENIYFQGNLMGFGREEMDGKVQQILDFADIGDFIHQPVKNYSSGMYVRLAFACSINVEPDILIVDEALSVGDAKIQRKCFQRMDEIRKKGTTILFVTHDISATKSFCDRSILIESGTLVRDGLPIDVAVDYFRLLFPNEDGGLEDRESEIQENSLTITDDLASSSSVPVDLSVVSNVFGLGGASIDGVTINGLKNGIINGGDQITVTVNYSWNQDRIKQICIDEGVQPNLIMGVSVSDIKGTYLFGMTNYDKNISSDPYAVDKSTIKFNFVFPEIVNGDYLMNVAIALGTQEIHVQLKWLDGCFNFRAESSKKYVYGLFYNEYNVEKVI